MITIQIHYTDAIAVSMTVESLICIREAEEEKTLSKIVRYERFAQEIYRLNFPELGSA